MNQEFLLDNQGSKQGIYLSQQQIDLLFIVSCESKAQFESYFYKMCGQFPNQKLEDVIPNYESMSLEEAKRALFKKYQDSLTDFKTNHRLTLQEQALDKISKMRLSNGSPMPQEILSQVNVIFGSVKNNMKNMVYQSKLPSEFVSKYNEILNTLPSNCSPKDYIKALKKASTDLKIDEADKKIIDELIDDLVIKMTEMIQKCIESLLVMISEYDKKMRPLDGEKTEIDVFIQKFNRIMKDDFENIKSVSYEDMVALHREIMTNDRIDTIIIATGKYDNSIYSTGKTSYFDAYLTAKALQYCKMTGKHMRYHALFDYAHLTKLREAGKGPDDKDEILAEMKEFIIASFQFIEKYNASVRGTNKQTINVIEIFNELVEYNKEGEGPYEMAWEKYFGITIDDILECFKDIKKPEGVEFMYNETQLEESPERVAKVEEVFNEIMRKRPDLIDVFGNQMHIQHTHADPNEPDPKISPAAVEHGLDLMRRIQDGSYPIPGQEPKKVRIEITEFDLHICKETYLDRVVPMLKDGSYTPEKIVEQKKEWIKFISELIKSKGLDLDRITYWSLLDTVDHNLVRAWKEILDANPDMSIEELESSGMIPDSLYAGAFGTGASPLPQYAVEYSGLTSAEQIFAVEANSTSIPPELEELQPDQEPIQEQNQEPELTQENVRKLTYKYPGEIPNSGYISEYIILTVIIVILLSLVMLTIFAIA